MVYHFITKELDKVFEGKFECVGENAANILLFQYKLKKNLIMVKQFTYKLEFIDSFKFM